MSAAARRVGARAPNDGWKPAVAPTTASQINRYLDACVEWILAPPVDCADVTPLETIDASAEDDVAACDEALLGGTDEDAILRPRRPCFLCAEATERRVLANPFCRAHLANLCASCEASLNARND